MRVLTQASVMGSSWMWCLSRAPHWQLCWLSKPRGASVALFYVLFCGLLVNVLILCVALSSASVALLDVLLCGLLVWLCSVWCSVVYLCGFVLCGALWSASVALFCVLLCGLLVWLCFVSCSVVCLFGFVLRLALWSACLLLCGAQWSASVALFCAVLCGLSATSTITPPAPPARLHRKEFGACLQVSVTA